MTTPNPQLPGRLSAPELAEQLRIGSPIQVVDVRDDQELDLARLPHPVLHLPLSRSQEWLETLSSQLALDQPVVVLCHAGVRSWQFACWLIEVHGHGEVADLIGGIEAWSTDVDPTVPRY
jgi:rhodanese-related sulfurtransferase